MSRTKWYGLAGLFAGAILGIVIMWYASLFSARDYLLSTKFYYNLPSGGYIYVEDEYIRYDSSNFTGMLDYQITLNYKDVEGDK